jgi:hypothetical protein
MVQSHLHFINILTVCFTKVHHNAVLTSPSSSFVHCFVRNFITKILCLLFCYTCFEIEFCECSFSATVGTMDIADMSHTSWQLDPQTGAKQRVLNYTMPLNQSFGPRSSQVTETQVSAIWYSQICSREVSYCIWNILTSWAVWSLTLLKYVG